MAGLGPARPGREPTRFDVTGVLAERNELVIEVELPPLSYADEQRLRPERAGLPGGLIGEVRLEIFRGQSQSRERQRAA